MHFKEFYRRHKKLFPNLKTTLFIVAIQIQNVWTHMIHLKIWSAHPKIYPKASNNQDFVIIVFYAWITTVLIVLSWFTQKTLIQFLVIDYLIGSGHDCQCKCSKCVSYMPQPNFGQNCHIEYGLKFYSSLCMNFLTTWIIGIIHA